MLILFLIFTRIKQTPTTILPKQPHIKLWFIYSICNLIKKIPTCYISFSSIPNIIYLLLFLSHFKCNVSSNTCLTRLRSECGKRDMFNEPSHEKITDVVLNFIFGCKKFCILQFFTNKSFTASISKTNGIFY